MKTAGLVLITLSFLAGAYFSVLDETSVNWVALGNILVVGFAGVALARIGSKTAATASHVLASNMAAVRSSLDNVVTRLGKLVDEKETLPTYDVHKQIDATLLDDLNEFVEARKAISHTFGLQAYADIMSNYAGGERYLNRVWSASADGYVDEVKAYLVRALEQFKEAREKLGALEGTATGSPAPDPGSASETRGW